ncbi:tetratricopeptide repeat protein [Vreelandella olivaria]|uniref:tetratricopeptide repeat protein n=1 Tax=Vreelandella olivaria TaxID=390919 RepID=UPI00201F17D0|nr:hypothetical protein [Halomonas olivaria]
MQRLAGVILFGIWASFAQASEPLPGDIIQDLNALQQQLAEAGGGDRQGTLDSVAARAASQAARLQNGNRSDQWASALYYQLAAGAMAQQGRQEEAADQLANARQRSSVSADQASRWLREEAELRRVAGQREEAIALYEQWLSNHDDTRVSWRLTRLLAEAERWDRASERLSSLLEQSDSLTESQQALVLVVFRNAGQGQQALSWLLDDLNEQSAPDAWRQAAGLAQQAGQQGVAAGIWEMAWQLGKFSEPDDLLTLVQLHISGGTPARAAEHLEQALEVGIVERDEKILRLLATAWQQAKHIDNALAAWQALAELTDQAGDWRQYGQLAYAWGEEAIAEQALLQAANLGDEEVEPWLANFH